jgi:hypothetical protein
MAHARRLIAILIGCAAWCIASTTGGFVGAASFGMILMACGTLQPAMLVHTERPHLPPRVR